MGNDNHVVVSHKLCGFQGRVGGCVVMMEPVVVAPKYQSFPSHVLCQASQNVTERVKVRADRRGRRNKFAVNNPLHIEGGGGGEQTMSMLFVELWIIRDFFALSHFGPFHSNDCCFVSGS
jgi:hypothetical protein